MLSKRNILWIIVTLIFFFAGGVGGYVTSNYQQDRFLSARAFTLKVRAAVLYDERDFDKAVAVLNQSIALNPDDYAPFQMLGKIYNNAGRKDLALTMYQTALETPIKPMRLSILLKKLMLLHMIEKQSKKKLKAWVAQLRSKGQP